MTGPEEISDSSVEVGGHKEPGIGSGEAACNRLRADYARGGTEFVAKEQRVVVPVMKRRKRRVCKPGRLHIGAMQPTSRREGEDRQEKVEGDGRAVGVDDAGVEQREGGDRRESASHTDEAPRGVVSHVSSLLRRRARG